MKMVTIKLKQDIAMDNLVEHYTYTAGTVLDVPLIKGYYGSYVLELSENRCLVYSDDSDLYEIVEEYL